MSYNADYDYREMVIEHYSKYNQKRRYTGVHYKVK